MQRRILLRRGLQVLGAVGLAPLASRSWGASCSSENSESLRISLNYKEASPVAAQTCSVCSFYTAAGACGSCTIMSDNVDPKGHCDSWAPKG